ncbi:Thiamine repressible genes regulatory protein thi5 [Cyberlindnera fabianii]|uniref:Thiamine repressible genes regulatory protein thi5 n=1 Tax=Cyberlindnera fabianii TaxID=36022 RepID=A0A1V2L570_CYBFA|nr:Thiamine repressible genes regulatory protein thi5 [Cyberlindnera fabianii]
MPQAGKKSHACGPCRRLKRKCDLQIPCGTCKSGRNTRVDECLANPARPLNNIQELIAPNQKFGRVHRNSTTHSPVSSSDNSPKVGPKRQKIERKSSFGQFETRSDDHRSPMSPLAHQKQPGMDNGTGAVNQHMNNMSMNYQSQHMLPQPQPGSLGGIPSFHQQTPQWQPHLIQPHSSAPLPQKQSLPSYQSSLPLPPATSTTQQSQQQYQPPQQQQQHPHRLSSTYGSPSATSGVPGTSSVPLVDANMNIQQQLQAQMQRIQMLESENAENRATINSLQHELNSRSDNPGTSVSGVSSVSHESRKIRNEYKWKYIKLLPSKIQTKLLVEFYLTNIDYIYHPIHHPSFRDSLDKFWKDEIDVDIGWLATLLLVLGLAAIHLPKGLINIDPSEIERSHKIWFDCSKECITIADSMRKTSSEFNQYILQWFSLCQLYFYATRRAEELNDYLAKAIKDAHDMGLDKDDSQNPNLLEVELKRRLWWDICGCDTFRSLSLGVKPIIRSYNSLVPLPSNANDVDITPDSIKVCSKNVPTDNSFNMYRAQMMKIMNGIFEKEHKVKASEWKGLSEIPDAVFRGLTEIDMELAHTNKSWFFELDKDGSVPYVIDPKIHFQHHMLHTCICIHRFRIFQNYLQEGIPIAWEVARSTARALFQVYRRLRDIYDLKNPLFLPQIHQSFTGSVVQSMMLMLNKMTLSDQTALYADIDLMLRDLEILGKDVFILKPEVLKESFNVLNILRKNIKENLTELEKEQKDIVSNVFGGKDMTESYLKKCTVSFIIDGKQDQQEQPDELLAYDYTNQLGILLDEDLVQKTVAKFADLDKAGTSIADRRMSIRPPGTPMFGPQSGRQTNGHNSPQNTSPSAANMGDFQSLNDEHERTRHMTPFDLNFNNVDTFWSDMSQQGLDELNNMYYSEFSGYKIG